MVSEEAMKKAGLVSGSMLEREEGGNEVRL